VAELDTFEGTREELLAHAGELRGKRVRLTIISKTGNVGATTEPAQPQNLAEFLGDFIGSIEGNGANNSEQSGDKFTQYLVKKQAEGHL